MYFVTLIAWVVAVINSLRLAATIYDENDYNGKSGYFRRLNDHMNGTRRWWPKAQLTWSIILSILWLIYYYN